jgi:hypothetical protein
VSRSINVTVLRLRLLIAPDDRTAGAAAEPSGGPLGWPTAVGARQLGWFRRELIMEELGPAFDGFALRGYDPVAGPPEVTPTFPGR